MGGHKGYHLGWYWVLGPLHAIAQDLRGISSPDSADLGKPPTTVSGESFQTPSF